MDTALKAKRDTIFARSVTVTPDKFDAEYDSGYKDYLASGGQAIIDERTEKWEKFFGNAVDLP
ncbi:hypothetical protein FACS189490_07600 [Clostridia bacterium]|nr:hypothetical protein FACS189490_07600 [Clostridia bacterium]